MVEHFTRVYGIGRATADPISRPTQNGLMVTVGFVANERYKSGGEWRDAPTFIDLEAFGDLAARVYDTVRKGYLILVEGRLRMEEYKDREQKTRRRYKIILSSIKIIERPKGREPEPPQSTPPTVSGQNSDPGPDPEVV